MFINPVAFLIAPQKQWQKLSELPTNQFVSILLYPIVMVALATYAWFYGITEVGWSIGSEGSVIKVSKESATHISVAAYFTMLIGISIIGYLVHWMSATYNAETSPTKGIALVSCTATPLYFASLSGFYPELWINLTLALAAVGWSIYLLYSGVPTLMNIPKEQGFLYASAVASVGMVMIIALMGATVIAWSSGLAPIFVD
jgi:hypothetical protein